MMIPTSFLLAILAGLPNSLELGCAGKESPGPLREIPEGWVQLLRDSVDNARGAYHDDRTGAFVEFEGPVVGEELALPPWVEEEDVIERGSVNGFRYEGVTVGNARMRIVEYFSRVAGDLISEVEETMGVALPPPGVPVFVVFFDGPSIPFIFTVAVTAPEQETRVRELLFDAARWSECVEVEPGSRRAVAKELVTELRLGVSYTDVVSTLGPPFDSHRTENGGFLLDYAAKTDGDVVEGVLLFFDKARRLNRIEVGRKLN